MTKSQHKYVCVHWLCVEDLSVGGVFVFVGVWGCGCVIVGVLHVFMVECVNVY